MVLHRLNIFDLGFEKSNKKLSLSLWNAFSQSFLLQLRLVPVMGTTKRDRRALADPLRLHSATLFSINCVSSMGSPRIHGSCVQDHLVYYYQKVFEVYYIVLSDDTYLQLCILLSFG